MAFESLMAYQPAKLGLQVKGTDFIRNGKPFRGIGINHFSLAHNVGIDMLVGGKRDGAADIAEIKSWGFPFIRVAFGMFDRTSWLYRWNNQATVWGYLDSIVAKCEAAGVGLIPTLIWDTIGFCDLSYLLYGTNEGPAKLAVPGSNVRNLAQQWLTDVVTRYRNSPAIWAWAISNETTTRTGAEYYQYWAPDGTLFPWLNWGTRPDGSKYTTGDYLSRAGWAEFSRWAIEIITQADGYGRLVSPGSALGNSYAVTCQTANSYAADTTAQWNVAGDKLPWVRYRDQSFPIVTAHIYPQNVASGVVFFNDQPRTNGQLIALHKGWADQIGKPFFCEEFGATACNPGAGLPGDPGVDLQSVDAATEAAGFNSALSAIVANDVKLSALWNYDGNLSSSIAWQTWKLRNEPTRLYQLQAAAAANAVMAASN